MSPEDLRPSSLPPDSGSPSTEADPPTPPAKRNRGCLIVGLAGGVVFVLFVLATAFPGSHFPINRKKAQARTLAKSLVNCCKGYYAEYSKYPLPQDGSASEVIALRTDEILTGTLLGTNLETNPKRIKFLPDLEAVEKGSGSGLLAQGDTATIVDPWGGQYFVVMDTNGDGKIENPNAGSTTTELFQGVLVYSAGPDKDPSTWEDNVMSWDSGETHDPNARKPTK